MSARARVALEIALRIGLIALGLHAMPRVFNGDLAHFHYYGRFSAAHWLPYRGGFAYEFPPLTLPFVYLGHLRINDQAYRWIFGLIMAGFEYSSLILLRRTWPEHRRAINLNWYLAVVPISTLAWFRFDFVSVFFATLALIAMETRRRSPAPGIIAGFATKLWPAVLIPTLAAARRYRDAAIAGAGSLLFLIAWYAWSPSGFHRFLEFRKGSGLEIESIPASIVLLTPHQHIRVASGAWVMGYGGWQWVSTVLTGILLVYALVVCALAWLRHDKANFVALAGALTLASFLLSRIISAQYIVWTAPFVALLFARGHRRTGWLNVVSTVLTVGYLLVFEAYHEGNRLIAGVTLLRNLVLIALLVDLTYLALGGGRRAEDDDENIRSNVAATR